MNAGLVFLLTRSVRGRIVRSLRLLKQPKYLIGVVVFFGWMVFWVGGVLFFDDDSGEINVEFANVELLYSVVGEALPIIHTAVALVLALLLSLWWLLPWSRMALDLTEAEIHMLTPMPLKRRHLIQFATTKAQPGILFGCLMMTLFLGTGGPLERLRWFALFWLMLSLWDLHSKGRSLWLERQKELPAPTSWRNRLVLVTSIVVFWLVLGASLYDFGQRAFALLSAIGSEIPDFESVADNAPLLRETLASFVPDLRSGVIGWLLTPFLWVTAPLFLAAPGVEMSQKLIGILVPFGLLVAHNEWVVRSGVKFEEAALAHVRREAKKEQTGSRYWKTSARSRRRVPFTLAPAGPPELAILWKNSMIVTRFPYKTLVMFGAAVVVVAVSAPLLFSTYRAPPFILMALGFMTFVISPFTGSQNYRNDLRSDLLLVEMVRPWPIEGWKLFAAQAAGPTVYATMTTLFGAALVCATTLLMALGIGPYGLAPEALRLGSPELSATLGVPPLLMAPLAIISILPIVFAATCLGTSLQNLLVLVFPGWVQLGKKGQKGAAAFGQNMIMFFGLALANLLSLLPGGLIVAAIVAIQWFAFGIPIVAWELPFLGIIAATPMLAVVALIVRTGGRVWDNLDPSREVLEGSA